MSAFGYLSDIATVVPAITATEGLAAATDVNGAACDMRDGYDSVLIAVQLGAIVTNAVTAVKVQQDTVSNFATAADLLGSAQTVADSADGKMVLIDIRQPTKQYLRVVVTRATQNATVSAVYIKYSNSRRPVTHATAAVLGTEQFVAPAEGTA